VCSSDLRQAGEQVGERVEGQIARVLSTEEQAARALAARIGLSAREQEVYQLIIKGRNVPYIRDELIISRNTVNTHVKHIYAKAAVHNRQELIDLIEQECGFISLSGGASGERSYP
jgi:DNA-binding CsgD family transcriptional regulator